MTAAYITLTLLLGTVTVNGDTAELPRRISLAQALERFHQVGFDLLLADASTYGAEADVKIAGAVANPILTASYLQAVGYNPGCPGCDASGYGLMISDSAALMDIISGRRGLRVDVARAALRASRLGREDAQRNLDALLKEQYLAVALDQATLLFTEEVRDSMAKTLKLFNLRYAQGDVSEADLVRVEVQGLESEQDVDEAQADLVADKVVLAFLLGVRGVVPGFEVEVEWMKNPLPMAEEALDTPDLLQYAVVHRPDLRAQAAQRERAETSIALNRRSLVPDLYIQFGYSQQGVGNEAINPPTYTLTLNLTPPVFYQYQGEIQSARADLRTQSVMFNKMTAQVASDIGASHQAMITSRSRLNRMDRHLRGRAARVLELVRLQYNKGAAALLDLLDAQRTFTAVNEEWFDTLNDYWTARFELEQAMGLQVQP